MQSIYPFTRIKTIWYNIIKTKMNRTNNKDVTNDDIFQFPTQFCLILDLRNWDFEGENTSECLIYHYPDVSIYMPIE